MNATQIFCAIALCLSYASAWAQYVGPNGAPATVRQLLDSGYDHAPVVLKGRITSRTAYNDLYQFSDGTGTVHIKLKHWPLGLKIDDRTRVEISGKFDREMLGFSKIKVVDIRPVD